MSRVIKAALGAFAALIALELLLRMLPVSSATMTGYYIDPMIITYPPGHRWQASTGWDLRNAQVMRANNYGFAASRNFTPDPRAVALIGDSFVEASALPEVDRPAPQLERALAGRRPVYALGGPGSSLLDYAERIRWASTMLDVRDFVLLLEAGDVRQSVCGSGNNHGACLRPGSLEPGQQLSAEAGPLKRLFRHSALAQYLLGQLKADPLQLLRAAVTRDVPKEGKAPEFARRIAGRVTEVEPPPYVDVVTLTFLERALPNVRGRLVVVVDGGRHERHDTDVQGERQRFLDLARSRGVVALDAESMFRSHREHSARSLEVGPYDGHMNRLAVEMLMRETARLVP